MIENIQMSELSERSPALLPWFKENQMSRSNPNTSGMLSMFDDGPVADNEIHPGAFDLQAKKASLCLKIMHLLTARKGIISEATAY